MKIIGFNFKKISIERFSVDFKKIEVKTNIEISEIKEINSDIIKSDEKLLAINFSYFINYEPKIAEISFKGEILFFIEPKKAKEILKEWKDKKIYQDIKTPLFNLILKKSNIKALYLEDELGLPYHLPLPSLKEE